MPPRFAPEELDAIQRFQEEEGLWIDTVIRSMNPRWLVYLAERNNGTGIIARTAALLASWNSGLEKKHNKHTALNLRTKGFRKPQQSERLDAITTTLYRHVRSCKEVRDREGNLTRPTCGPACVVASHRFDVGLQLR